MPKLACRLPKSRGELELQLPKWTSAGSWESEIQFLGVVSPSPSFYTSWIFTYFSVPIQVNVPPLNFWSDSVKSKFFKSARCHTVIESGWRVWITRNARISQLYALVMEELPNGSQWTVHQKRERTHLDFGGSCIIQSLVLACFLWPARITQQY